MLPTKFQIKSETNIKYRINYLFNVMLKKIFLWFDVDPDLKLYWLRDINTTVYWYIQHSYEMFGAGCWYWEHLVLLFWSDCLLLNMKSWRNMPTIYNNKQINIDKHLLNIVVEYFSAYQPKTRTDNSIYFLENHRQCLTHHETWIFYPNFKFH